MWQKFIAGQFVIWFWNLAWILEIKFRYGDLLVIMTDIGMNLHRQGWFDGLLVGNHFGQQETEHDKYNPLDLKTSPHSGKVPRNTLLRKLNRFMWPGELIYIIDFTHENHSPLPGRVHRRQKLGAYLDAKLRTRKKKAKFSSQGVLMNQPAPCTGGVRCLGSKHFLYLSIKEMILENLMD